MKYNIRKNSWIRIRFEVFWSTFPNFFTTWIHEQYACIYVLCVRTYSVRQISVNQIRASNDETYSQSDWICWLTCTPREVSSSTGTIDVETSLKLFNVSVFFHLSLLCFFETSTFRCSWKIERSRWDFIPRRENTNENGGSNERTKTGTDSRYGRREK